MSSAPIDALSVAAIRALSIDTVEKAKSGHPGLPMGSAPMAYVLWTRFMHHNPSNPNWFNRDRFVLSAGHGSALLYSLLHLMEYGVSIDDLKGFRQWGSLTPGHPEYMHTPGVETTTGPLAQGFANAVGMAMAERFMATRYNKPGFSIVDHFTYALVGDGDLMEGLSYEAASLAGHMKLDRLIVLYDSNDISLDGPTDRAFTEDVKARFEAAHWFVQRVDDGNDLGQIEAAIREAKNHEGQPSLIEVRTIIGYGSPGLQGTSEAHGKPLGSKEAELAKQSYGWNYEPFFVPDEVHAHFQQLVQAGGERELEWQNLLTAYRNRYPDVAAEFEEAIAGDLPQGWDEEMPVYPVETKPMATRQASGLALNFFAESIPNFAGGSADLASSNNTTIKGEGIFSSADYSGRNFWFGVREHAMGAILNGLTLHKGMQVFGATFMVFSDYLRPSIRLASLMKIPVRYVFTHDTIAVGEDGPTHEPVEHLAALRVIPNLITIRPADANETMAAWHFALAHRDRPVAFALTRQALPILAGTVEGALKGVEHGGYVVAKEKGTHIDAIIIAAGSEVSLACDAKARLEEANLSIRVVSLPAMRLFDEQPESYRESVLPKAVKARVCVEMASPFGWNKYAGDAGKILSVDRFGESAPLPVLLEKFGFTVQHVVDAVQSCLKEL